MMSSRYIIEMFQLSAFKSDCAQNQKPTTFEWLAEIFKKDFKASSITFMQRPNHLYVPLVKISNNCRIIEKCFNRFIYTSKKQNLKM